MTEETDISQPYDFASDPHGFTVEDIKPKDLWLEVLLNLIHGLDSDHHGGLSLTVSARGTIASGIAISQDEWLQLTVDKLNEGVGTTLGDTLNEYQTDFKSILKDRRESRDAEDRPQAARRFLHMKDARLDPGKSQITFPTWRIPLEDVSGWSVGSLAASVEK